MPFLKTRGNLQAFKPKIGLIGAFFVEIWPIKVLQFFKKKLVDFEFYGRQRVNKRSKNSKNGLKG